MTDADKIVATTFAVARCGGLGSGSRKIRSQNTRYFFSCLTRVTLVLFDICETGHLSAGADIKS